MTPGTLNIGEVHPSSHSAMSYIKSILTNGEVSLLIESIASTALSGNRLCQISLETLQRIQNGEPVSDRYVLGLAWFLKDLQEINSNEYCVKCKNEFVACVCMDGDVEEFYRSFF